MDLKNNFPTGSYTPHGYIDNPWHTRMLNMSGVIRSHPAVGMGWWYPTSRFSSGNNAGCEYVSLLQLGFKVGNTRLAAPGDFGAAGVELSSRYYTKNLKSFDFETNGLQFSAQYLLPDEHFLACRLVISNTSRQAQTVDVYATHIYRIIAARWWGADGLAGYYRKDKDATVQICWAGGPAFAVGADRASDSHSFAYSQQEWADKCSGDWQNTDNGALHGTEPMYGILRSSVEVKPGATEVITFGLARANNGNWALDGLKSGLANVDAALSARLEDDDRFYSGCPTLTGSWPDHWKHGWIYDWETQRMNSRPPVGIYKHHWDAMQVHEPRAVLGETAIDAMMLSYADPELAKEELYGVFADAPGPQVPCTREDGSVNMVAADGSECGTAPSWCFPFHMIHSVYCRYPDKEWLAKLYPYLEIYLNWWFENRTDGDGWFHCKCSWESGQDGSKRFLLEPDGEGDVADYVRTVDVEASVAEALWLMAYYAKILGKGTDERRWREMAEHRTLHTRDMFRDGWYRDVDARNGEPIILDEYYDIMMFTPITCGVATPEQIEAIKPMLRYFADNPGYWLEWPSFVFPFTEAAVTSGENQLISDTLYKITDVIYSRLDARTVTPKQGEMNYGVPGVSYEWWPGAHWNSAPGGGFENYGWGATMPTNIIRGIFGFHESIDPEVSSFELSPTIPMPLLTAGKTYGITKLRYRGVEFDLEYAVDEGGKISTLLSFRSESPVTLTASAEAISTVSASGKTGTLKLEATNGTRFRISVS